MICPAKSAQELLAEFRNTGRQEPFEEIVRRFAAMVFHVCFQVLKNRHDAEDATQAVFLTLAVQGKTNKEIRNIGPWLQQVAKRLSLDLKKARMRRHAREHRHGMSNSNGGNGLALGGGLDSQELRHILSEELNQLAPKYRLPLILHYFGGLSREQMSQELGCKAATLGVRLHRGREMLAARLSQRGVALTAAGLGLLLSYLVRESVTENLIWSTSHVASQMAAGHPVGAGVVSARAMALARSAGNTLAVAKVKAIVASVLIAATAVAAGQVASKVRPIDLKFQGPAGERLLDLLRPKLPEFRTDATPSKPAPNAPAVAVSTNENPPATTSPTATAVASADLVPSAPGAEWGGSILSGRWIGSATMTQIPGIIWSSPSSFSAPVAVSNSPSRYAIGPLAAPAFRQATAQQTPIIMVQSQVRPPLGDLPQKGKRRAPQEPTEGSAHPDSAPAPILPFSSIQPVASAGDDGPRLYLGPASADGRSHPSLPAVTPIPSSAQTFTVNGSGELVALGSDGMSFLITQSSDFKALPQSGNFELVKMTGASTDSPSSTTVLTYWADHADHDHHNHRGPQVLTQSAFDGVSTISTGSGIIKGYGTAHSAAELNQSGQVIADGYGQERTLDLSAVGAIKNSIDNSRTGHNGWFAQNKGKLVLPAVALNNGTATWGEDAADSQLDLINSVRLSVSPDVVGSIKLSLLSVDRSDYPALPGNLKAIGLWNVEPIDLVLASAEVAVRYDVDLVNDLRLADLSLWGYDGKWKLAEDSSLDSNNRLISGRVVGIDYLAVAGSAQPGGHITGTPEPAAMLGLVCAGLILSRRRRK